jgi:Arylsulfotransferase (ASST)
MNALKARQRAVGVLVALLALGVLAGLEGVVAQARAALQLSAQPSLFPTFDRSVSDYVVRCEPSNEVQVSVVATGGTKVSLDNGPLRRGSFQQTVSLAAGQSFDLTVRSSGETTSHFIRCLPSDFPAFTATRSGSTQAEWYVVTPGLGLPPSGVSRQYAAFFDNNGVPVWWMRSSGSSIPLDAKLLSNGHVAWLHHDETGAEERRLDGSLVRTLNTVENDADEHDIQLRNGNYLIGRYFDRSGVDMSSCGGSSSRTLIDFELQELTPGGDLVWSWRASDHIPFSEVTAPWESQCRTGSGDIYHWNSVEPDGDGYVLSFRHLDAVYRIERETGDIDWKLGGEFRPERLNVVGDTRWFTFRGQHDARVLGDGSLTVHDNGTGLRPPRAARFAINETANTATLLESVTDPDAPASACCGSTRRLPGGNWVSEWGANPYVTEQTQTGARVFKLSFTQLLFSYRANPVLPGQLSAAALRAGMDAQYPRP